MQIVEHTTNGVTMLEIRGRIDTTTSSMLGERLTALLQQAPARVVLDLRDARYISSAGFRILLQAAKLADETAGRFALANLSAELSRLFDIGAFTDLFTIHGSAAEAAAACGAPKAAACRTY